jgi:methenyltetrahydromethanopterin cyclohydrolase
MGRTNDAIVFGGQVQLYVRGDDEAAKRLAEQLPSSSSQDYGRPFAQVFKAYEYDFFKVDPMLFSPAKIVITALDSGRSFHAGEIDAKLLYDSFGD